MIRGLSIAQLRRTVRLGFKGLWLHRLRSLLTVLGIVFGVCSVIAMLAIGEGASHEAQEQIKNLGARTSSSAASNRRRNKRSANGTAKAASCNTASLIRM